MIHDLRLVIGLWLVIIALKLLPKDSPWAVAISVALVMAGEKEGVHRASII